MKMLLKTASIFTLLCVAPQSLVAQTPTAGESSQAIDPQKLAVATQLIDAIMPPESREAMMGSMMRPMMENIQATLEKSSDLQRALGEDPEVKTIFQNFLQRQNERTISALQKELPSMTVAMSRAYARQFTIQEMNDARAFYLSPSGRVFMARAGGIMSDPDILKWQQDLMGNMLSGMDSQVQALLDEVKAHKAKKKRSN